MIKRWFIDRVFLLVSFSFSLFFGYVNLTLLTCHEVYFAEYTLIVFTN